MDVTVALYFYHLGVNHGVYHYWYFGLTVTFILVRTLMPCWLNTEAFFLFSVSDDCYP